MQEAALRACGRSGWYQLVDVSAAELPEVLLRMRAGEVRGANVTVPHKAVMASACDELVGDAMLCGVVNTITVEGGRLIGDNTDADGFQLGLSANQLWVKGGADVVIVGGGGVAAACALALSRAPARIVLTTRRIGQAEAVRDQLWPVVVSSVVGWRSPELADALRSASLVVNATSAGLRAMPFFIRDLPPTCGVADVRYRPRPVDLVAAAREAGHPACDGLEMLLQQGMLAFQLWTGEEPPWSAARAALHERVGV